MRRKNPTRRISSKTENNNNTFLAHPNSFLHRGEIKYDTGLKLNHLQKSIIIALDIFQKNTQTITTELDAWLYFLCSDEPSRIWEIQEKFPFFRPLYHDIFRFQQNIGEVLHMYSEALQILDRNTTLLMIDEMKQELEQKDQTIEQQTKEIEHLREELAKRSGTKK